MAVVNLPDVTRASALTNGTAYAQTRSSGPSSKPVSTNKARRRQPELSAADENLDLQIFFPRAGRIHFLSKAIFSDPRSGIAREFIERVFLAPEVDQVEIDAAKGNAEIFYRAENGSDRTVVKKISRLLADKRQVTD